jgi:hypothetical protein
MPLITPIAGAITSSNKILSGSYHRIGSTSMTNSQTLLFSGIDQSFTHLRAIVQTIGPQGTMYVWINTTNPAGTPYNWSETYYTPDTTYTYGNTSSPIGSYNHNAAGFGTLGQSFHTNSSVPNTIIFDIPYYSSTSIDKQINSFGGYDNNGNGTFYTSTNNYLDTSAVSSLYIGLSSPTSSPTYFSLYGIK